MKIVDNITEQIMHPVPLARYECQLNSWSERWKGAVRRGPNSVPGLVDWAILQALSHLLLT